LTEATKLVGAYQVGELARSHPQELLLYRKMYVDDANSKIKKIQ
jgi:hypothetical protein